MGRYLNPGMESFEKSVNSEIYVDKTGLIGYTNRVMNTVQGYVCVSRPRRFGKSMAANMLTAYYSRGCDSREIFSKFEISESPDFEKYRNKYNTIFLNMQEFLSRSDSVEALVDRVKKLVLRDLKREYPDVDYFDDTDLVESMQDIYETEKCPFVVIIDEWDCIFREFRQNKEAQEKYLDFLRDLLKDKAMYSLSVYDGYFANKEIWNPFCIKYV
ncbi:MAG: AAA family ATPase [Ruminococcus sp.]